MTINKTDEQFAEAIAQRDRSPEAWRLAQDACRELYEHHARRLLAFLAARVPRSTLDDLHQEVWQRVWQHLPQFLDDLALYEGPFIRAVNENPAEFTRDKMSLYNHLKQTKSRT